MVEKLIAQGRQLLRLLPCLPKQHTLTGKNNKSAEKDLPKRSTKRIRLININSSITVYYINSDVAGKLLIPTFRREIHGISGSDLQLEIKILLSVIQIAGPLM